jgi:thiol-disulfide isomerase/thioredoxin
MPYSKKKKPTRRIRRRNAINSTVGTIAPYLDVRSKSDIPGFINRVNQGPLVIVVVYADWCGACHQFMPTFKETVKNTNENKAQTVSINGDVIEDVNRALAKNNSKSTFKVEAFPTLFEVTQDGAINEMPRDLLSKRVTDPSLKQRNNPIKTPTMKLASHDNEPVLNLDKNKVSPSTIEPLQPLQQPVNNRFEKPHTEQVTEYVPNMITRGGRVRTRYLGKSLYKKMARSVGPRMSSFLEKIKTHLRTQKRRK